MRSSRRENTPRGCTHNRLPSSQPATSNDVPDHAPATQSSPSRWRSRPEPYAMGGGRRRSIEHAANRDDHTGRRRETTMRPARRPHRPLMARLRSPDDPARSKVSFPSLRRCHYGPMPVASAGEGPRRGLRLRWFARRTRRRRPVADGWREKRIAGCAHRRRPTGSSAPPCARLRGRRTGRCVLSSAARSSRRRRPPRIVRRAAVRGGTVSRSRRPTSRSRDSRARTRIWRPRSGGEGAPDWRRSSCRRARLPHVNRTGARCRVSPISQAMAGSSSRLRIRPRRCFAPGPGSRDVVRQPADELS